MTRPSSAPAGIAQPTGRQVLTGQRCDRCAADARVLMIIRALTLTLCGHHFAQHEPMLLATGWTMAADSRADLLIR